MMKLGVFHALLAAALFGASTPFAKLLMGDIPPITLAGLLYAGSGIGLTMLWVLMRRGFTSSEAKLTRIQVPWLLGAILFGGILAPVLLMSGMTMITGSAASLLLNLEGVCTALLAWFVFKENFDRRIFLGMLAIVAGGIVLSWHEQQITGNAIPWGGLLVAAACLCWGIDNNLTRKVSASDPLQIAAIKGVVAGSVNLSLAAIIGAQFPAWPILLSTGIVGFLGYGLSLVLFVLALRHLGTARTGAYFSIAPFVGAGIAFLLLGDVPDATFWIACGLMALGVWLHLTERHEHKHTHEVMDHEHAHAHDAHHQHSHDFDWDGTEPHTHPHRHEPLTHSHAHFPDIHHRHGHKPE